MISLMPQDNPKPSALQMLEAQMDGIITQLVPTAPKKPKLDLYEMQIENAMRLSQVKQDMREIIMEAIQFEQMAQARKEQADNLEKLVGLFYE